MEINIPTEQDILRDITIQYVNKAFVYITDCNPPLIVYTVHSSCYPTVGMILVPRTQ